MANINLVKGGTPGIRFMWCAGDYPEFAPPYNAVNYRDTPPYDGHMDGAYNLGHFTMGMPVKPNGVGMAWQRNMFLDRKPQVDDFIVLMALPEDHFVTAINFKIPDPDTRMAGATVALTAQEVTVDPVTGEYVYTEIMDVEDAVAAQGALSPIPVDNPANVFVSLMKTDTGYAVPLYANPSLMPATGQTQPTYGRYLLLGVKIVSLPTDAEVTFAHMLNGWYLSAKIQGFECPTYL